MIKIRWLIFTIVCVLLASACGANDTSGVVPNSAEPLQSAAYTVTTATVVGEPLQPVNRVEVPAAEVGNSQSAESPQPVAQTTEALVTAAVVLPTETPLPPTPTFEPTSTTAPPLVQEQTIGRSTAGLPIDSVTMGRGEKTIVLVGGIHGGYEWNTVLLSYQLIDYFKANLAELPHNTRLVIIPAANPDGVQAVTGRVGRFEAADVGPDRTIGRFNSNAVDLNRNWDCEWQPQSTWRSQIVSAGTAAFSEAEAHVLRTYLETLTPELVIFYHSVADGVYLGQCGSAQHPDTLVFSAIYAEAATYALHPVFTAYAITGDASDYLNRVGVPSFTVELTSVTETQFEQNLAGVQQLLKRISERTSR